MELVSERVLILLSCLFFNVLVYDFSPHCCFFRSSSVNLMIT